MKLKNMLAAITVLFVCGCHRTAHEPTEVKTESATVVDLVYMPKNHGSGMNPNMNMKGEFGLTFTEVDIPEKFAIVFECQHGKFIIENDQKRAKELYQRLRRDQKVQVTYREIYKTVRKGKELVKPPTFVKYDFIDAK